MAFEGATITTLVPLSGSSFLINGRPFNGTGFGFNAALRRAAHCNRSRHHFAVNAKDSNSNLYALQPNPRFFSGSPTATPAYPSAGGLGGFDEDYDADDWNNLASGWRRSRTHRAPRRLIRRFIGPI